MNDFGLLERVLSDIYSPEMIINKTNISVCKTTFLNISINRGRFYVKLHGKRNYYSFDVINYFFSFLDGNIPKGQSYRIFISQLVRLVLILIVRLITSCKVARI